MSNARRKTNHFKLYDFQHDTINWVFSHFIKRQNKKTWVLISSPTSTGKTYIGLMSLYKIWQKDREKFNPYFLTYSRIAKEQAIQKVSFLYENELICYNFFCQISQGIETIHRFSQDNYVLSKNCIVVVDEAHHLTQNAVFKKSLKSNLKIDFLIGLTGTARESYYDDGFSDIKKIAREDTGIKFPSLNKIDIKITQEDANILKFKNIYKKCNSTNDVIHILEDEDKLKVIINLLTERIYSHRNEFKKAIIFYPFENGISSRYFVEALIKKFQSEKIVLPVYGKETTTTNKLNDIIDAFINDPEIVFLIGNQMLDEALDISKIDALIFTKPTSSDIKYSQMIGRGLRPDPDKKETKIYDFRDNYDCFHNVISRDDYLFAGSNPTKNNQDHYNYISTDDDRITDYVPIVHHEVIRKILFEQLEYFAWIKPDGTSSETNMTPSEVVKFLSLFCYNINHDGSFLGEYYHQFNLTLQEVKPIFSETTGNPLEVRVVKQIVKPLLQKKYGNKIKLTTEFNVNNGRIDLLLENDPHIIFEFSIDDASDKLDQILFYKKEFEHIYSKNVSRCIIIGPSFLQVTKSRIIDELNNVEFINWKDFFISYCTEKN